MNLVLSEHYDVVIVGSGIAGLSAAVEAAERGCSSIIICSSHLFSGSSFYPGTWGFGLVGPEDEADEADLIDTVCSIGCGMADSNMVKSFVKGINPAINRLKALGCHPQKAENGGEREYIPCFDHKHRNWNGLRAQDLKQVFCSHIKKNHIKVLEHCTLLDIVKQEDRISGFVAAHNGEIKYYGCSALVLATGGYGSLFKYHLCPDNIQGAGHCMALKAGCQLVNMEFMQMMLGFIYPARNTIFNEKTFRYAKFLSHDGRPLLSASDDTLLDHRSMYGPFTSRLSSALVDQKIHREFIDAQKPIILSYADRINTDTPEIIRLYFDWLKESKGISSEDSIQVAFFSHAANGGIKIDSRAQTGVAGLFACGEVTGGMHGADRIGGLSTANCLVFGQQAGITAAEYVSQMNREDILPPSTFDYQPLIFRNPDFIINSVQECMYHHAFVIRTEEGLSAAIAELEALLMSGTRESSTSSTNIVQSQSAECSLIASLCVLRSALLRRESRGSHYREDYPETNPKMCHAICIHYDNDKIIVDFQNI